MMVCSYLQYVTNQMDLLNLRKSADFCVKSKNSYFLSFNNCFERIFKLHNQFESNTKSDAQRSSLIYSTDEHLLLLF